MGLPNIGPVELIIVLAIALLIVGPRRLPEMGNAFGRTIREFRKASSAVSDPFASEPEPEKASGPTTMDAPPMGTSENVAKTATGVAGNGQAD